MTAHDIDDDPELTPDDEPRALVPVLATLDELVTLRGDALEHIEIKIKILSTARVGAIARLTFPRDYTLFKAPDEQGGAVTAYLEDAGCRRVRDIFGIESFDVGRPEKIAGTDPGSFLYVIVGSGRCKLTGQVLESVEGARVSTDPVFKGKSGPELDLAVRRAARANLEGSLVRNLGGLKNIPLDELSRIWQGTGKSVEQCSKGKGYGTRDQRLGGAGPVDEPKVPPPVCEVCRSPMRYKASGAKGPFYYCPKFDKHRDRPFYVDAAEWLAKQAAPTPAAPTPAAPVEDGPCSICGATRAEHVNADHDWER